jgi:CRISPR system Cascade subunit CasD
MHTLLIRLIGPMQSWGIQSRFGVRDTGREPSKSGVVGLLCAALGRPRSAPLEDLVALPMGVRVDREGRMEVDFHTAKDVYRASAGIKDTEVSRRYYLADAAFLVGLESPASELLHELHQALKDPVWPLYLGRKAFVPSAPVWLRDGLRDGEPLEQALRSYPFLSRSEPPEHLRVMLDDPKKGKIVRPDLPISFSERRFATRRVRSTFFPAPPAAAQGKPPTENQ